MPCMGPSKPTDEEVDRVFASVVESLRNEHKLLTTPESSLLPPMQSHREQALSRLREAIAEVMWQEACESF